MVRMASAATDEAKEGSSLAIGYSLAGALTTASWLTISWIALSSHPVAAVDAACGLRHNALTIAQALAFPLPVIWAVSESLRSAAAADGLNRLKSATYRRLNLGLAMTSMYTATAVWFSPAFAVGYDMFPTSVRIGCTATHAMTSLLALSTWVRTVKPSSKPMEGHYLPRIIRGAVGSLFALLAPKNQSAGSIDDPDQSEGGSTLYALATIGLLVLAVMPQLTSFPLATIPTILGKRLSRTASGFTFLGAVGAYCLKDAAERGRLNASTFQTLRQGLGVGAVLHLLIVALKVAGVDGGGLLLPGRGLWEFYPSMAGAPKATLAMVITYASLAFAASTPPPSMEDK